MKIQIFKHTIADGTFGRGRESSGGPPVQVRHCGCAAVGRAAGVHPGVPEPRRANVLHFEHTGAACAHSVPLPQVSENQEDFYFLKINLKEVQGHLS